MQPLFSKMFIFIAYVCILGRFLISDVGIVITYITEENSLDTMHLTELMVKIETVWNAGLSIKLILK